MQALAADLAQHEEDTRRLGYERNLMLVSREAVATLVDGDWTVRQLGVVEAEAKRSGDGADRTAPTAGTSDVHGVSSVANGAESAPAPPRCAECGTELTSAGEIRRAAEPLGGSKYDGCCDDCVLLKAGLL